MAADEKMVYTTCQGWGCHDYCILSTIVNANGEIERCEPMHVPKHIEEDPRQQVHGCFKDRSGICVKGCASVKIPFIENRLLHPLKRIGERGEGKWEEVSWDQAYTEISQKIESIVERYGTHSIIQNYFPCGTPNYNIGLAMSLNFRFCEAFGTTMLEQEPIDLCDIIGPTTWSGENYLLLLNNNDRIYTSDYIVVWGANPLGGTRAANTTRYLSDVQDAGVKIVDIGIVYDSTAANANQFIGINPASDAAFVFAVCKIIFDTSRLDEDFLLTETGAPFLVREDTGKYLRESDVVEGGLDWYMVWDKTAGCAKPVAPHFHDMEGIDADLFADVEVKGIPCKSSLLLIRERCDPYTPEYQKTFTGIDEETLRLFTEEYLSHKDALIWMGAGLRYKNSIEVSRAIALLPLLTGKLYNEAAGITFEASGKNWPVSYNNMGVWIDGLPELKGTYTAMQEILDSFDDPSAQQYRAFLNFAGNPVHNWPPRGMWRDQFFPQMELIVVSEIRMSETASFADYVLPAATVFEREDVAATGNCLVYCEPAIPPRGESHDDCDIIVDLARSLGLDEHFDKTMDEWRDIYFASPDPQLAPPDSPITMERLRKEKVIAMNTPPEMAQFYRSNEPRTPSGRYEFYTEELAGIYGGGTVDRQLAMIDNQERRLLYPLHLFIGRSRYFMQGQFREIAELDRLAGPGPSVGMTPEDAAARGIREGDMVEIFNERGVVKVPVYFTRFVQPGTAHLWYCYGQDQYKDSEPAQEIASYVGVYDAITEISKTWNPIVLDRIIETGVPQALTFLDGVVGCETIWDVLCDVRKAD